METLEEAALAFNLSASGPGRPGHRSPHDCAACRVQRKGRHPSKLELSSGDLWVFSSHKGADSVPNSTQGTPEGQRSGDSIGRSGNVENQEHPVSDWGLAVLWSFCKLRTLGTASQPLRTHSRLERPSFTSHAKGHFGFAQVSEAWHSGVCVGGTGHLTVTARPWIVTICHAGRMCLLGT